RSLPQPRQHLEPGITIGRVHAGLGLEIAHRAHGVRADAAIDAVDLEALLLQVALDLLNFGERRRALAAGELLVEWATAADEIAEMHQSERVARGRIVRAHGEEVLSDQERRAAWHRQPQPHAIGGAVERGAIGARDAETVPFRVRAPGAVIGK